MAEGPRAGHQRARTFLSTRARPTPRRSPTGGTLRSLSVTPARRRGPLVPGKAARGATRWTHRGGGRAVCSVREGPRSRAAPRRPPPAQSALRGPGQRGAWRASRQPAPRRRGRASPDAETLRPPWWSLPPRSSKDFQAEGPGRSPEAPVMLGEGPVVPGHRRGRLRPLRTGRAEGAPLGLESRSACCVPDPPRTLGQLRPSPEEGRRWIGERCSRDVGEAWRRAAREDTWGPGRQCSRVLP